MLGVGLSLSDRILVGGGHAAPAPSLQPIATRLFAPQSGANVTAGKAQAFTRYNAFLGAKPVTEIRIAYQNYSVNETGVGGALTVTNAALELDDQIVKSVAFTWSGQPGPGAINSGDNSPLSDALPASAFGLAAFPPNSSVWFRTDATTTATQWVYGPQANTLAAEQAICATAPFAVQSGNTGQVAGLTGQQTITSTGGPHPSIVLGKIQGLSNSVIFMGDSIGIGINDTSTVPIWGRGAFGRMNSAFFGQANIPYLNVSGAGEAITGNSFTKRSVWFPYASTAVIEYGVNDMKTGGGSTAAVTLAANLVLAGTLKAAGVKYVYLTSISAYTTSTDGWATVGNQTAIDTTVPTVSQQYNTLLAALSDSRVDGIIDQGNTLRDGTTPSKWAAPGVAWTSDGLHPLSNAMAVIAPLTRTAVQAKGNTLPDPDVTWIRPNAAFDWDFKNDRYFGTGKYDYVTTIFDRGSTAFATDPTFQKLYAFGPGIVNFTCKRIVPGTGLFMNAATINLFASPFAPATQTVTVVNGTTYTVSIIGPGSLTLSGANTGTVVAGTPVTFAAAGTSLTATVTGSPLAMQVEASAYATMPVTGTGIRDDFKCALSNLIGTAGAVVVTCRAVPRTNGAIFGQGGGFTVRRASSTTVAVANPALTVTIGSAGTFAGRVATGMTWDAGGVSACANGGTVATTATTLGVHTSWVFGGLNQASTSIDDVIERITIFPATRISDATLQAEAIVR